MVTVHPSSILRQRDADAREEALRGASSPTCGSVAEQLG